MQPSPIAPASPADRVLPPLALVLAAGGAPFAASPGGVVACALAFVIGIVAIRRAPRGPLRTTAWAATVGAGLALSIVFTVRVAAPNIVIAGQKAAGRQAVATLRTLLWAEDQLITRHGRAGTIGELAGARGLGDAPPLDAPLLRPPFMRLVPGARGEVVDFGGFTYAIYVLTPDGAVTDGRGAVPAGAVDYLAYAWPTEPGRTGYQSYCLNRYEDILEREGDAGYAGTANPPAWDACVTGPAPAGRLGDGTGRDGAIWRRWRGKETRRGKLSPDDPVTGRAATPRPSTSTP